MQGYLSGTISNWLNITPVPFEWVNFGGTSSFLSWFYQFPWKFADWLGLVFWITENWISILATVFVVCMILFVLFRFTTTNHN